jgi:hypothetical protein
LHKRGAAAYLYTYTEGMALQEGGYCITIYIYRRDGLTRGGLLHNYIHIQKGRPYKRGDMYIVMQ